MTRDPGIQITITDAMRQDFVTGNLVATQNTENTILKGDLRSAFAHWLSEEHGRYTKGLDNPEAGKLYDAIFEFFGPLEESRDENGHAIFVGLVITIPSGPQQTYFSPREMNTHDWTTHRIQNIGDGMESKLEICPCGTWRLRFVEQDTNGKTLKNVVIHIEYSKSYEAEKIRTGAHCPHTGKRP